MVEGEHPPVTIRLYVGSDPQQSIAERALEASVRANTSQPVEITWCRQGDPGWDWGGRDAGWATPFSMFRWFVPEACDYQGRAIYMDCDQLALGDLTELWEWPIPEGSCGMYAGRSSFKADVILWKCWLAPRWTRQDYVSRNSMARIGGGKALLGCRLPPEWDHCDELHDDTKILHFTKMSWQPWKPYETRFAYDKAHPDPKAEALFWHYANLNENLSGVQERSGTPDGN